MIINGPPCTPGLMCLKAVSSMAHAGQGKAAQTHASMEGAPQNHTLGPCHEVHVHCVQMRNHCRFYRLPCPDATLAHRCSAHTGLSVFYPQISIPSRLTKNVQIALCKQGRQKDALWMGAQAVNFTEPPWASIGHASAPVMSTHFTLHLSRVVQPAPPTELPLLILQVKGCDVGGGHAVKQASRNRMPHGVQVCG